MAWPNPFRRKDENTRTAWGFTFQLTDEHLSPEQAHPLKFSYDVLGEECLNRLNAISPPNKLPPNPEAPVAGGEDKEKPREDEKEEKPREDEKEKKTKGGKRDLFELLKRHHAEDEKLGELWREINTVPEWVDWDQISRGQGRLQPSFGYFVDVLYV